MPELSPESAEAIHAALDRRDAGSLSLEGLYSLSTEMELEPEDLEAWTMARAALREIAGASPAVEQPPPRDLGAYEIVEELARGGMGVVYRARHTDLQREVAIKVLIAGEHASPRQRERFRLEALATARLRHPHIVAIHDVGEAEGCPYLVMDLVEGVSLQERLNTQGPLPSREAAQIARKVASALGYAHDHLILHRDLKPGNVLVTAEGEPLLTDFGLAKLETDQDGSPTKTGQVIGTPAYMSPQQALGEVLDRRSDVYGLGATLYALLTGRPPFEGDGVLHVLAQISANSPMPPGRVVAGVDPSLELICLKCLEKNPDDRYESAQALEEELRCYLEDEPIRARPPTLLERMARWRRRNRTAARALMASAALVIAVAAGAVGWVVSTRASERAAATAQARDAALAADAALREQGDAGVDERTGLALRALQAAIRWRDLAEDDPAAAARLHEATFALGEVALASRQWALARDSFARAVGLGVDDAAAEAAVARVDATRRGRAEARRREVSSLLAQARSGELERRPEGVTDAVFGLVRLAAEPDGARLLCAELEDAAARLFAAEADLLSEAARDGAAAIRALCSRRAEGPLSPSDAERYRRAVRRLAPRGTELEARRRLETTLADRVGRGRLTAARICAEALGRVEVERARAARALGRYLSAEPSAERATRAGLALVRLGGRAADRALRRALRRFGHNSSFGRQVIRAQASRPLRGTPRAADGWVERAELLTLRGDLAAARRALDEAIRRDPKLARAWAARGSARLAAGDPAGARDDLTRAIELDPKLGGAYTNRGNALLALKQVEAALADFEAGIRLAPESALSWTARGLARRVVNDLPGALSDANQAIAVDADFAPAHALRGLVHRARGRLSAAIQAFDRALELAPREANVWVNRGNARFLQGDHAGALSDFDRALELQPGFPLARFNRGQVHQARKDYAAAVRDYDFALEGDPKNARIWAQRGRSYRSLGRVEQALSDFDQSLKLDPRHAETLTWRASAKRALGDPRGAVQDCTAALRIDPRCVGAFLNRGNAWGDLRRSQEAVADYGRALAIEPNNLIGLTNRASALYALRRYDEALSDCDRLLKLRPDDLLGLANRGRTLAALGRRRAALTDLRRFLKLAPRRQPGRSEIARLVERLR